MTDLLKTLGVQSEEEALQILAAATAPPVVITLSWTPLSGVGMSVMGTEDAALIEQILMGAVKELWTTKKEPGE